MSADFPRNERLRCQQDGENELMERKRGEMKKSAMQIEQIFRKKLHSDKKEH